MIPLKDRKFGWVRDTFDPRDFTYQPKFRLVLPASATIVLTD